MDRNQFTADVSLGACTLGANTSPKDRISKVVYDDAGQVVQGEGGRAACRAGSGMT